MTVVSTATVNDSASVRDYLIEALRLDLIGPRTGDEVLQYERLPSAPSRWYLTGFLAPTGAPDAQRAQDAEEELDEPSEPTQGGDDASAPERGSGKRVFLPSSMGLSLLADASATRLDIALSWGDYAPEEDPLQAMQETRAMSPATSRPRVRAGAASHLGSAVRVQRPATSILRRFQSGRRFGSTCPRATASSSSAWFGKPGFGEPKAVWTPAPSPCSSSIGGPRGRTTICRTRLSLSRSR